MTKEVFLTILHHAVQIHKINTEDPTKKTLDRDYLQHMDDLKEKYDEWCKPKGSGESRQNS